MSSRALRRLQRERDTELCSISQCGEGKADDSAGTLDDATADTADSVHDRDISNHKTYLGSTNFFDLVITVT